MCEHFKAKDLHGTQSVGGVGQVQPTEHTMADEAWAWKSAPTRVLNTEAERQGAPRHALVATAVWWSPAMQSATEACHGVDSGGGGRQEVRMTRSPD